MTYQQTRLVCFVSNYINVNIIQRVSRTTTDKRKTQIRRSISCEHTLYHCTVLTLRIKRYVAEVNYLLSSIDFVEFSLIILHQSF